MLVGWVALVPWLMVLDRAVTFRATLVAGFAMTIAFTLAMFGWFADAVAAYAETSRGFAWLLLAVGSPALQPQFLTFAIARRSLRRDLGPALGAIGAALVYVGTESAWPKLFADTIGHGLQPSVWLRQGADLAGAEGLTLVLLLVNECVGAAIARHREGARGMARTLAPAGALVAALALYGVVRLAQVAQATELDPQPPVRAGLVQASITGYENLRRTRGTYGAVEWIVDEHLALTREAVARDVDFVAWPETVYPTTFGHPKSEDGRAFDEAIVGAVEHSRVPIVFGSYDADEVSEYNAAFFLSPTNDGGVSVATYRKAYLFPLTERVPAWLDHPSVRARMPWLGTWRAGAGEHAVGFGLRDGRSVRVAPLICLDAVVADHALEAVRDGAELILTLSNDSWFATTAGARLHLIVSAFRSIETRRPQLRVTNSGISAVVAADGELVETTQVGERTALVASIVPVRGISTLMLRWGDWLGGYALGAAFVLLFVAAARRRNA